MPHEQRQEAATAQPEEPKEPIDEERAAREVAARLEQLEGDREDDDLRHEREHGARAAEHAVGEERGDEALAEDAFASHARASPTSLSIRLDAGIGDEEDGREERAP